MNISRHILSTILVTMTLAPVLASCAITEPALKAVNDQVVLRYCDAVSPDWREVTRRHLADSCKVSARGQECGLVVLCPGETWDGVLRPLGYSVMPLAQ